MWRIPIVCAVVATGYLAVQVGNRGYFRKQILTIVSMCYGTGLIYFTFLSRSVGDSRINVIPFFSIIRSLRYPLRIENFWLMLQNGQWEMVFTTFIPIVNAVLNILLFVPFGFLLPEWEKQMTLFQVLITGVLISGMIESVQMVTGLGWFDVDDLLCNFFGIVLGTLMYMVGSKINRRDRI